MRVLRWFVFLSLGLLFGCSPEIPTGTYVCEVNSDCPPDQTCAPTGLCERDVGCVPNTCEELRAFCGEIDDGCGGTLECGECTGTDTCGGGGIPNICDCEPLDCSGAECGSLDNGCGATLDCGVCPMGLSCSDTNECECVRSGCGTDGCGTIVRCGATEVCGGCTAPEVCGGGGPDRCGTEPCVPRDCGDPGAECGMTTDGCGTMLDCSDSMCAPDEICNGEGNCECISQTCESLAVDCGVYDNCGGELDCGGCTGNGSCTAEGACVCEADTRADTPEDARMGDAFTDDEKVQSDWTVDSMDEDWWHWELPSSGGATEPLGTLTLDVTLGHDAMDTLDLEVRLDFDCSNALDRRITCPVGTQVLSPSMPGCRSSTVPPPKSVRLRYTTGVGCRPAGFFVRVVPASVVPTCEPYELEISLEQTELGGL